MNKKSKIYSLKIFISCFIFAGICACECEFQEIITGDLPDGIVGKNYNATIDVKTENCNVQSKYAWIVSGELPPGISMSDEGQLTGKPALKGVYTFTVTIEICFSENTDCHEKSKGFFIEVVEENP